MPAGAWLGLGAVAYAVALFAASPEGPRFSHRRHLALSLPCAGCHASAPASTTAEDDNRPPGDICLQCHDAQKSALARARPTPRRHFRFDHKRHLALGDPGARIAAAIDAGDYLGDAATAAVVRPHLGTGDACRSCHRGLEASDEVTSAQLPRMADCLVCHQPVQMPASCGTCHTPEAQLVPATHTPDFADRHSSRQQVPDKSGCPACHGRRFTCMGCH